MHQGPYLIPAGAPPGSPLLTEDERPPEAVYYFRIYAVLMVLLLMVPIGWGMYMMLQPIMNGSAGTSAAAGEWIFGLIIAGFSFCFLVPHVIALFGGRQRWVYTLSMILIGLNVLTGSFCCLLVTIPLLIYWMKPETKRWYGAA
jgi:hypothetical protein